MIDGVPFGSLVLFAAATTLTPGPNVIMVTASAANFGFRRAIPQMLGITFGFAVMIAAAGLGLAGLAGSFPHLHVLLKYAGAIYLAYLALRIARADAGGSAPHRTKPIGFVEACLFTWINPKAWVMAMGAIATYTTAGNTLVRETAAITAVLAIACLASCIVWAAFGTIIGRTLATSRARTTFNWSMASLLLLSLILVLW